MKQVKGEFTYGINIGSCYTIHNYDQMKPCYWQTNFVTKSPETHGDDLFSRLNPRFSGKSFEGCVKITIFAPDYLGLRITL